jgi:hypothetical protein
MNIPGLSRIIGFEIRERRRDLELTAAELSDISGVDTQRIIELEWFMLDDIDILSVNELCNALNIDLPKLLNRALNAKLPGPRTKQRFHNRQ